MRPIADGIVIRNVNKSALLAASTLVFFSPFEIFAAISGRTIVATEMPKMESGSWMNRSAKYICVMQPVFKNEQNSESTNILTCATPEPMRTGISFLNMVFIFGLTRIFAIFGIVKFLYFA
ncbi:hypothetical protein FACS1894113_5180 [Alphaproteobacteria bacterium]|nr:hypothetical protein FACS1894113_5180 [Alphaproteobacteria bacterium]